jgi:hypothetical protein
MIYAVQKALLHDQGMRETLLIDTYYQHCDRQPLGLGQSEYNEI